MSDIKVFRIDGDTVSELQGQSMSVEKSLQTLIEYDLDALMPSVLDRAFKGQL